MIVITGRASQLFGSPIISLTTVAGGMTTSGVDVRIRSAAMTPAERAIYEQLNEPIILHRGYATSAKYYRNLLD